jgi:dihydrofolate reductase
MGWVFDVDGRTSRIACKRGGAFRGPFFVLRHDPPAQPPVVKGVTGQFLEVGIEEAVTVAKKAADGANVVILGANVARQCLEAGLLDEIIVHIAPVLVGGGAFASLRAPVALRSG